MFQKLKDRNEFEEPVAEVKPLLQRIPAFGQLVRRFPYGNDRKYFITEPITVFHGLTGYLSMMYKKRGEDEALIKYRINKGENWYDEFTHAADYGTFLHISCAEFLTNGKLDLEPLKDEFFEYCKSTGMPLVRWKNYSYRLVNDLKSFAQFCHDKEVEPLACEYPVYDRLHAVATPIDLVCKMKFNKKIIVATINYKFRENPGLYNKDIKQTNLERRIYNIKFGDSKFEATHCFVWTPSKWRTNPTYKLTNTTDKYTAEEMRMDHSIMKTAGVLGININADYTSKSGGTIELGKPVISEGQTVKQYISQFKI